MLQNKNFTKLISITLALFLWVYVVAVENPPTKIKIDKIPVKLINVDSLEERGLAINAENEYFTEVVVEGSRSDVIKLDEEDIDAKADIDGYRLGLNSVPIEIKLPPNVEMVEQRLQKIEVLIEKLIVAEHPVEVSFVGEINQDEEPAVFGAAPQNVFVRGAASSVAKVISLRADLPTTKARYEKQKLQATVKAVDAAGREVTGIELSTSKIMVEAARYVVKEVALDVNVRGTPDSKYQLIGMTVPETVKIKGLKADIDGIERLRSSDVDISSVNSNVVIPVSVKLPKNVRLAAGSEPAVDITIRGVSNREVYVDKSNISVVGSGENESVKIIDEELKVRLTGSDSALNTIKASDIRLTLDVTGLEEGTHKVNAGIESPNRVSGIKAVIDPVNVSIIKE